VGWPANTEMLKRNFTSTVFNFCSTF